MPPVAKKFLQYEPGSPEEALQARVTERYGGNNEAFFRAVADRLGIRDDSASGAFYQAIRRERSLPESHKAVYAELLDLPLADVSAIGREALTRDPADPLAALRAEIDGLRAELDRAMRGQEFLHERVSKLEAGRGRSRRRAVPGERPTLPDAKR